MRNGLRLMAIPAVALLLGGGWAAARSSDEVARVQDSLDVLRDLTSTPDNSIPNYLLDRAEAIVVIPSLVKGGFVVGAKHGKGVISTRGEGRSWSSPAFVTMTGGSVGWQVGVASVDLVLLVMNRDGVNDLLADKFTVGGNASVAAGPVGRSAEAATDAKLSSQILAYSRTKGLFAGAVLEGSSLRGDKDGNKAFYSRPIGVREVVALNAPPSNAPEIATTWRHTLATISASGK